MLQLEFQRALSPCTACCFGFIPVVCPVVIGIFVIVFLFNLHLTSSSRACFWCLLRVDLLFVCLYCLLFVLFVVFTSNNTVMHKLIVVLVCFPLAVC